MEPKRSLADVAEEIKQTQTALDACAKDHKAIQQYEADLFDWHRSSLLPLRELEAHTFSIQSEQRRQDMLADVNQIGRVVDQVLEEKREKLRQKEKALEDKLDQLGYERQILLVVEEEKQPHGN